MNTQILCFDCSTKKEKKKAVSKASIFKFKVLKWRFYSLSGCDLTHYKSDLCCVVFVCEHSHNGLSHMFKGLLHKLPHAVNLPRGDYKIVWLLWLQHQPHSLKETETGRSNHRKIIKTVWCSTLDTAQLYSDRQEVNLRPLSGALACTSFLTSPRRLMGHKLWEKMTDHSQITPTGPSVLLPHTKMHMWSWKLKH